MTVVPADDDAVVLTASAASLSIKYSAVSEAQTR